MDFKQINYSTWPITYSPRDMSHRGARSRDLPPNKVSGFVTVRYECLQGFKDYVQKSVRLGANTSLYVIVRGGVDKYMSGQ